VDERGTVEEESLKIGGRLEYSFRVSFVVSFPNYGSRLIVFSFTIVGSPGSSRGATA